MSRKRFTVTPERAAAIEVDPRLVLAVIGKMAVGDQWTHTGRGELLPLCAETYTEDFGFEPGVDARRDHHFEVICALVARMKALSRIMENGKLQPGDASPEAMAEATSAARLTRDEDGFKFQPAEFFTLLDRADAEPRK